MSNNTQFDSLLKSLNLELEKLDAKIAEHETPSAPLYTPLPEDTTEPAPLYTPEEKPVAPSYVPLPEDIAEPQPAVTEPEVPAFSKSTSVLPDLPSYPVLQSEPIEVQPEYEQVELPAEYTEELPTETPVETLNETPTEAFDEAEGFEFSNTAPENYGRKANGKSILLAISLFFNFAVILAVIALILSGSISFVADSDSTNKASSSTNSSATNPSSSDNTNDGTTNTPGSASESTEGGQQTSSSNAQVSKFLPLYTSKGSGYVLFLTSETEISHISFTSNYEGEPDGRIEVRATKATTPTSGDILAETQLSNNVSLSFSPTKGDTFVIWFADLPTTLDGASPKLQNVTVN